MKYIDKKIHSVLLQWNILLSLFMPVKHEIIILSKHLKVKVSIS